MKIGYIGLGKMGHNMVERLLEQKYEVFAYDENEETRQKARRAGVNVSNSIGDLISSVSAPRVIWLMVPHSVVDDVILKLKPLLSKGDIVVDGGNSYFKDSMRRAEELKNSNIKFLDVGVSGGPSGAREGASLMIGGEKADFRDLKSLFADIAAKDAYAYLGRAGAGHFVKMIHNGIEYGMMQAIAEGFAIMEKSDFDFDLEKVAGLYNHRSVVESRLVGWLRDAYREFGRDMKDVSGSVEQSGEGAWTVETAKELGVPVRVIEDALNFRFESKDNPSYTGKLLSAMRNQFGGHRVK